MQASNTKKRYCRVNDNIDAVWILNFCVFFSPLSISTRMCPRSIRLPFISMALRKTLAKIINDRLIALMYAQLFQ